MIAHDGTLTLRRIARSSDRTATELGLPVRPDVVLDWPRSRHISVGMRAYADAMARLVPQIAPDLRTLVIERETTASLAEQLTLPGALARANGRLIHHLSPYAPLLGPVPFVITIHDLVHLRYPSHFKATVPYYYRSIVRRVCAAAARVIVDDDRTTADLALYLDVDPAKVRAIPLGVDERFRATEIAPYLNALPSAPDRPRPYLLYAGNHRAHKDLPTLFAAWAALPESLELDLLLTGPDDFAGTPLPWRRSSAMRVLGEVPAERLPALYRGAAALVHPALCEGFGLTLVEAAAVGTRVIACEDAVPSLVAPHVETFPARDHRRLAELLAVAPDAARIAAARTIARDLTWERCARATAEVYREVLAQSKA